MEESQSLELILSESQAVAKKEKQKSFWESALPTYSWPVRRLWEWRRKRAAKHFFDVMRFAKKLGEVKAYFTKSGKKAFRYTDIAIDNLNEEITVSEQGVYHIDSDEINTRLFLVAHAAEHGYDISEAEDTLLKMVDTFPLLDTPDPNNGKEERETYFRISRDAYNALEALTHHYLNIDHLHGVAMLMKKHIGPGTAEEGLVNPQVIKVLQGVVEKDGGEKRTNAAELLTIYYHFQMQNGASGAIYRERLPDQEMVRVIKDLLSKEDTVLGATRAMDLLAKHGMDITQHVEPLSHRAKKRIPASASKLNASQALTRHYLRIGEYGGVEDLLTDDHFRETVLGALNVLKSYAEEGNNTFLSDDTPRSGKLRRALIEILVKDEFIPSVCGDVYELLDVYEKQGGEISPFDEAVDSSRKKHEEQEAEWKPNAHPRGGYFDRKAKRRHAQLKKAQEKAQRRMGKAATGSAVDQYLLLAEEKAKIAREKADVDRQIAALRRQNRELTKEYKLADRAERGDYVPSISTIGDPYFNPSMLDESVVHPVSEKQSMHEEMIRAFIDTKQAESVLNLGPKKRSFSGVSYGSDDEDLRSPADEIAKSNKRIEELDREIRDLWRISENIVLDRGGEYGAGRFDLTGERAYQAEWDDICRQIEDLQREKERLMEQLYGESKEEILSKADSLYGRTKSAISAEQKLVDQFYSRSEEGQQRMFDDLGMEGVTSRGEPEADAEYAGTPEEDDPSLYSEFLGGMVSKAHQEVSRALAPESFESDDDNGYAGAGSEPEADSEYPVWPAVEALEEALERVIEEKQRLFQAEEAEDSKPDDEDDE
jgi:hypothetical protein